ncbi:hypothetical protein BGZ51_004881 [Haplosporangium sp. Z 767]|nr:hypothetical protein BGZ51_004881 [Haplosporangium sp. Z 767]KAF9182476.1 hypothetical protein BGZ50_004905 [Haplosporangium sp. Z 11]
MGFHPDSYDFQPFCLIGDVITVLVFAYNLWGKSFRFQLPSSSPTSKSWLRILRVFFTLIIILLWCKNADVNLSSVDSLKQAMAVIAAIVGALMTLEMVWNIRISREQRRLLTEEERRCKDKYMGAGAAEQEGCSSAEMNGIEVSKVKAGGRRDSSEADEGEEARAMEIVRPEAVDPAVLIYSQQAMFEAFQKQYRQQQQYQAASSHQEGSCAGIEVGVAVDGKVDENSTTILEGKIDDLSATHESSFKYEVPIDTPLGLQEMPSLSSSNLVNSQVLPHQPSAPPLVTTIPTSKLAGRDSHHTPENQ